MPEGCKRCGAALLSGSADGYCDRCRRVEAIVKGGQTDEVAADRKRGEASDMTETAALRKRMLWCALGNFLCSAWHIYLGLSLLSRLSSSRKQMGAVFIAFAACQILAGAVMLAVPVAWLFIVDSLIFLFCAGMNMLAVQTGNASKAWQFLAYFQIMMMLDCWRRYSLFKNARQEEPAAVVRDSSPSESADGVASPAADPSAEEAGAAAGHFEGGRFVITDSEMSAILAAPEQFQNVIKTQVVGIGGSNETWYVVLTKGAAVMFDAAREHVWSMTSDDVTPTKRGIVAKSRDDRKKVGVLQFVGNHALWAWATESSEQFCETMPGFNRPTEWSLLGWALISGKTPVLWVRWTLPFATAEEGMRLLVGRPEDLDGVIREFGLLKAMKWTDAVPECAQALHQRLAAVAEQRGRSYKLYGIGSTAVGALLALIAVCSSGDFLMSFHRMGFTVLGSALVLCGGGFVVSAAHLKSRIPSVRATGDSPSTIDTDHSGYPKSSNKPDARDGL